jgi:hypothetical protein
MHQIVIVNGEVSIRYFCDTQCNLFGVSAVDPEFPQRKTVRLYFPPDRFAAVG